MTSQHIHLEVCSACLFCTDQVASMAVLPFRTVTWNDSSLGIPIRRRKTHWPYVSKLSRRLWKDRRFFYAILSILFLGTPSFHSGFSPSLFYASEGTGQSKGLPSSNTTKQEINKSHNSNRSKPSEPPSYLPLAQHLKYVNYTRTKISLRDMVFGTQKRTYPDLKPTNNYDLLRCKQCSQNCKFLGLSIPHDDHQLQLARLAVRLLTFYNFSSMVIFPCIDEIHWILPLNVAIREFNAKFEMYCAVPNDGSVVAVMKKYNRRQVAGSQFVVYQPMKFGALPKVDMLFSWRGLEQYDLEAIQDVFQEAIKQSIKTILVGNSPGYENAKVVETGIGTFSVKRPEVAGLNVRAYPFGFNEAMRVFSLVGKQLLLYNTSTMRDGW